MPSVLVVGGGLAGCWAALTAATAGAEVTVVRRALGATAMSAGAVDAVPPVEAADPQRWLDRLAVEDPAHPYLAAGDAPTLEQLEAELGAVARTLGSAGLPLEVDLRSPRLVAATTGQVRAAGALLRSIAAGDLRGRARVAVVGIAGLHRVSAAAVASSIAHRVTGVSTRALEVEAPPAWAGAGLDLADLDEPGVARMLDSPSEAGAFSRAVRARLEREDAAVDLVLTAPVLGLDHADGVLGRVRDELGVAVGELLAPPPSAPGWRLQIALDRALAAAGITAVGGAVTRLRTAGDRVVAAALAGGEVGCDALVLATGRFLGGGLTLEPLPREPLLDLPVFVQGREVGELGRADLVIRTSYRVQPVLAAGLRVDAGCRPVDRFGVARFANVVACGSLLAGIGASLEGGGLGVVAWTAGRAGRAAARLAGVAAAA